MKKSNSKISRCMLSCLLAMAIATMNLTAFAGTYNCFDEFNFSIDRIDGTPGTVYPLTSLKTRVDFGNAVLSPAERFAVGASGKGKRPGDSFLQMSQPYISSTVSNAQLDITANSDNIGLTLDQNNYLIFKTQFYPTGLDFEGVATFKFNGSWKSPITFASGGKIKAGNTQIGSYTPNTWNNFVMEFRQGTSTFNVYLNGNAILTGGDLGLTLATAQRPIFRINPYVTSTTTDSQSNQLYSTIYVDNFAFYTSSLPYDAASANVSVASTKYIIEDNKIQGCIGDTVGQVLQNISIPSGATAWVTDADDTTEFSQDVFIAADMKLVIESSDKGSLVSYELGYIDMINRDISAITKDTELSGNYYKNFNGSIMQLFRDATEANYSRLLGDDEVKSVTGLGKKDSDRFVRIFAPEHEKTANNKNIQFYNGTKYNLKGDAKLVLGFDIMFEKLMAVSFSLKLNGAWKEAKFYLSKYGELTVADGTKKIISNNWYHIDMIVNQSDGTYSCYVDGELVGTGNTTYTVPITTLDTVSLKVFNPFTDEGNDIAYLDNFRRYQTYSDYSMQACNTKLTSASYDIAENYIYGVPAGTSVSTFLSSIVKPENAQIKLLMDDEKTEVTSGNIEFGMKAAVYAADGMAVKVYNIAEEKYDVAFYKDKISSENAITTLVPGDIYVEATVPVTKTATLLAAVYKDNKLVQIVPSTSFTAVPSAQKVSVKLSNVPAGSNVRAMLWNNLQSIQPIINPRDLQ